MNLILIGPPGAGKGTQAEKLVATYKLPHYSTGDMLREAKAAGTAMGKLAQGFMDKGALVPDEVVIGIIHDVIEKAGKGRGFILDGFPRTVAQADALGVMLSRMGESIDRVVMLDEVPRSLILERITGRRTCPKDGSVYHVKTKPPKVEGVCDKDGTALVHRPDDTEEAITKRLDSYDKWTAAVVEYYEKLGTLRRVHGVGDPAEIFRGIQSAIG
jgi:adenylate kinase